MRWEVIQLAWWACMQTMVTGLHTGCAQGSVDLQVPSLCCQQQAAQVWRQHPCLTVMLGSLAAPLPCRACLVSDSQRKGCCWHWCQRQPNRCSYLLLSP